MIWRGRAAADFGDAGFTLVELIVVFAILGLVVMLFVSRVRGPSPGLTVRAAANELALDLREGRSAAIARNRPITVVVDATHRRWRGGDGSIKSFPTRAGVTLVLADGEVSRVGAIAIEFEADGSSTGGRVELASGGQRSIVGVDWLTGRVTVADVH